MSMGLTGGRHGEKCSGDGLTARGGGRWALLGCYYEGKIILCILVLMNTRTCIMDTAKLLRMQYI